MEYLIGLDIGTSSVKGVLMSTDGNVKSCKTKKHIYHEIDGFKTLDADEFCKGCFDVLKEIKSEICEYDKILAICPSGASGNLVFVKDGKAISPVYGWQNSFDDRITEEVILGLDGEYVYETVGWPKIKSMPLAALAYIRKTNPDLIDSSDMICMHIEYLNFCLTGKWGITPSIGTPFYLINQKKMEYEQKILDSLGIDKAKLPPIMKNCTSIGHMTEFAVEKTDLDKDTKVILGTFDHPSAARGAGVFDEDEILISCGTSWVVFVPVSEREKAISQKMLSDPFMHPGGKWCAMKSLTSVSDTIDKYMKKYLGDISFEELDTLADKAPIGANGLLLDDDTDTRGFEKSDIARAIMECIAIRLNEFLKVYAKDAKKIRLVGGITKSKVWCRVISEITGVNVSVVNGEHAGAVGSAIMAGVGVGIYENEKKAFYSIYGEEKH
ncbi:MAG: hypothetical protein E7394_00445 [Ruminococcaceae bacterium]|nr:hypothetical protein [Oscillospiraceae bacterium]